MLFFPAKRFSLISYLICFSNSTHVRSTAFIEARNVESLKVVNDSTVSSGNQTSQLAQWPPTPYQVDFPQDYGSVVFTTLGRSGENHHAQLFQKLMNFLLVRLSYPWDYSSSNIFAVLPDPLNHALPGIFNLEFQPGEQQERAKRYCLQVLQVLRHTTAVHGIRTFVARIDKWPNIIGNINLILHPHMTFPRHSAPVFMSIPGTMEVVVEVKGFGQLPYIGADRERALSLLQEAAFEFAASSPLSKFRFFDIASAQNVRLVFGMGASDKAEAAGFTNLVALNVVKALQAFLMSGDVRDVQFRVAQLAAGRIVHLGTGFLMDGQAAAPNIAKNASVGPVNIE